MGDEVEEEQEILRYVYDKRRSFLPRRMTDGGIAFLGKVYYIVEVVKYSSDSYTKHCYVETRRLTSEGFAMLKLSEDCVVSEKEVIDTLRD